MAKQNYRCAGCGTRIDPGVTDSLRKTSVDSEINVFVLKIFVLRVL